MIWSPRPGRRRSCRRDSRAPAVIAAGLLHAALLALLVVGHPRSPPPLGKRGSDHHSRERTDSPTSAPPRPRPKLQTARAETPIPAAKPPTPAPAPAVMPKPAPPASATAVAPKPSPSRPTPAAKPLTRPPDAPAVKPRPAKAFSLDALQADVAKAHRRAPGAARFRRARPDPRRDRVPRAAGRRPGDFAGGFGERHARSAAAARAPVESQLRGAWRRRGDRPHAFPSRRRRPV